MNFLPPFGPFGDLYLLLVFAAAPGLMRLASFILTLTWRVLKT